MIKKIACTVFISAQLVCMETPQIPRVRSASGTPRSGSKKQLFKNLIAAGRSPQKSTLPADQAYLGNVPFIQQFITTQPTEINTVFKGTHGEGTLLTLAVQGALITPEIDNHMNIISLLLHAGAQESGLDEILSEDTHQSRTLRTFIDKHKQRTQSVSAELHAIDALITMDKAEPQPQHKSDDLVSIVPQNISVPTEIEKPLSAVDIVPQNHETPSIQPVAVDSVNSLAIEIEIKDVLVITQAAPAEPSAPSNTEIPFIQPIAPVLVHAQKAEPSLPLSPKTPIIPVTHPVSVQKPTPFTPSLQKPKSVNFMSIMGLMGISGLALYGIHKARSHQQNSTN